MVDKMKAKSRFIERGLQSTDDDKKGVYIPPEKRLPHRPEYMTMSKKAVQEAEQKRRETEAKVSAYRKDIEEGLVSTEQGVVSKAVPPATATSEPAKAKKGRPKKIE